MDRRTKALGHNRGLNAMGAEVVNSTFVLLFGICSKLNICASIPPLRQAPKRCALWQATKLFNGKTKLLTINNRKDETKDYNINGSSSRYFYRELFQNYFK